MQRKNKSKKDKISNGEITDSNKVCIHDNNNTKVSKHIQLPNNQKLKSIIQTIIIIIISNANSADS